MSAVSRPPDPEAVEPRGEPGALPEGASGWAFFLDLDGTLIDIAPTPDAVEVPADLPAALERLAELAGGAVAVVTGRTIAVADLLLAPARLPVAGVHGGEFRLPGGRISAPPPSPALAGIRTALSAFVASEPGLLFEDKGISLAVHYRGAPDAAERVEAMVRRLAQAAGDLAVQAGKMVFELTPAHGGKGSAVEAFMAMPPFKGRRPLAIGDDLTDEGMFAAVNARGGVSVRVGTDARSTLASARLADPTAVRRWIRALVEGRLGSAGLVMA